ncbi:liver carboxylesterase-like isoform X1 [Cimex lectularius]|uniref:Carboxylesterase type B domain-containing protein n=1 Tax=Cimex lectularius TaxID=79782 RepID=A0A8I6SLM6_CIMLE|nr:liver carboxylesterase-like isoform X1 [Cimex lectularius]
MVLLYFILFAGLIEARIVRTPLGDVIGSVQTSRAGRKYYSFMKIPYAKPPVGNLRFRNPEPRGAWYGLRDGRERPPFCSQLIIFSPRIPKYVMGEEDCLYLNIFSLSHKQGMKMSVMVYFVGDNFRFGMANEPGLGNYLIDEEVILVVVQHRLGALGFLSLEDDIIPGNFGLKDQALALDWIKQYIKYFGGNPNSITVFGDGSGGASAHFLAVSHMTKDIVKAVISQGGVANDIWALAKPGKAKETAEKALLMLGCSGASYKILSCLRDKNASEIMKTEYELIYWDMEPNVVFQPVVEKYKAGSFLYENPLNSNTSFPWLVGFTSDEGQYKIYSMESQRYDEFKPFLNNLDSFIKKMFYPANESQKLDETVRMIRQRYFPKINDKQKMLTGLKDFYGFLNYVVPTFQALRRHVGQSYLYVFDFRFTSSPHSASPRYGFKGAPHAEETVALFDWTDPLDMREEQKVSREVTKMWANFAKYQKPTIELTLQWPQFINEKYLLIRENITAEKFYRKIWPLQPLKLTQQLPVCPLNCC